MSIRRRLTLSLAVILGLAVIAGGAVAGYQHSSRRSTPMVYSSKDMLQEMWSAYKRDHIEQSSGRTMDDQQGNITTSEGESYTMERAVWMDDQATFDRSWQWSKDNLQRDDHLMAWKFGKLPDGRYGIQTNAGGQNTASDGDSDIALSLLMAYSRWKEDRYLYDAKPLLNSIWEQEVVSVNGKPILTADNLERGDNSRVLINPSYLSPYAYKIFAHADKQHDWKALADNSYSVLQEASVSKLDASVSNGMPPDWVYLNRLTGRVEPATGANLSSKFSYDAIRTTWRVALDYAWFHDPRAKAQLSQYGFLQSQWNGSHTLVAAYNHDGSVANQDQSPAIYGATMGYFSVMQPDSANQIYHSKLSTLYSPDTQKPARPLSYYDANWAWFGTALYLHQLPNLAAGE